MDCFDINKIAPDDVIFIVSKDYLSRSRIVSSIISNLKAHDCLQQVFYLTSQEKINFKSLEDHTFSVIVLSLIDEPLSDEFVNNMIIYKQSFNIGFIILSETDNTISKFYDIADFIISKKNDDTQYQIIQNSLSIV
jgi:hypothetical protein